jgi:hypothetical protein
LNAISAEIVELPRSAGDHFIAVSNAWVNAPFSSAGSSFAVWCAPEANIALVPGTDFTKVAIHEEFTAPARPPTFTSLRYEAA